MVFSVFRGVREGFDILSISTTVSRSGLGIYGHLCACTRIVSAFGQDFFLKLRGLTQLMLVGADSIVKCLLEMGARTGVLSSHGSWQSAGDVSAAASGSGVCRAMRAMI